MAQSFFSVHVAQWFLTLVEVLNPTSSIHAFIEPFVVAKIKCESWILFFLLLLLKISCRRTPETDSPNTWGSIETSIFIIQFTPYVLWISIFGSWFIEIKFGSPDFYDIFFKKMYVLKKFIFPKIFIFFNCASIGPSIMLREMNLPDNQ